VINKSSSGNVERPGYFSTLPRRLAFEGVKLETRQSMKYRSEIRTSPLRLDQMKQREVKKFCIALINLINCVKPDNKSDGTDYDQRDPREMPPFKDS
jgi:hypothetical protein